jgi:hypothetical protein
MTLKPIVFFISLCAVSSLLAQSASDTRLPRCEVIPIEAHQVSFRIEGVEKFRWNYSQEYPRPFFYPFRGPSGALLTRMGHPGAPDHDHHQSIWFANNKVNGLDFWGMNKQTTIRQRQWFTYQDGETEAIMACVLDWIDPNGKAIMQQELIAAIVPTADGEHALEIQFTLTPSGSESHVELEKTNFGFFAVRVAKSISAHFGGGVLTNSEGKIGEKEIFAKPARWMDYSGPVPIGEGPKRTSIIEGITFYDHPSNRNYPTPWHVREDGWMGAAINLEHGMTLSKDTALRLRYLLHAHRGAYSHDKAAIVHEAFAKRSGFVVSKGTRPHHQYEVERVPEGR